MRWISLVGFVVLAVACAAPSATDGGGPPDVEATVEARAEGDQQNGGWVLTEEANPLDDTTTVMAALAPHEGVGIYGDPIALILRCKSGDFDIMITWQSYLGLDSTSVTHRIGSDPAVTKSWNLSTDNETTFLAIDVFGDELTKRFVRSMYGEETFLAQTTPYNESPITAVFDLTGIKPVADRVLSACS